MRRVLVILAALAILTGASMAFLNPLVLMSQMDGTLVRSSGEPAAGVRLVRSWDWAWGNRRGSDETATDAQGRFSFDRVTGRSMTARIMPHQPVIRQIITAETADGAIEIWRARKGDYDDNSELLGDALQVLCGLDALPGPESARLFASQCIRAPGTARGHRVATSSPDS